MRKPKFKPQPYTQSLIDSGVLKYFENTKDKHNGVHKEVYNVGMDYLIIFNANYFEYPRTIYSFVEIYIDDKFSDFTVYLYDDNITEWEDNYVPDNIMIYKAI